MLSLEHCRKILGAKVPISDEELATLRDQLYCFAELALDVRDKRQRVVSPVEGTFEQVADSQEDLDVLRERAAIMEFGGNISREEAERMAVTSSLANELEN
jgi:hypothetical protein